MRHVPEEITDLADAIVEGMMDEGRVYWFSKNDHAAEAGVGAFKRAYMILDSDGNETGWVVKYPQPNEPDWGRVWLEWLLYRAAMDRGEGHHFPATVWGETAAGTPYMVQEVVKECDSVVGLEGFPQEAIEEVIDWGHRFGICDLHGGNVGWTESDGRPVVLDWGVVAGTGSISRPLSSETALPAQQCWLAKNQWKEQVDPS